VYWFAVVLISVVGTLLTDFHGLTAAWAWGTSGTNALFLSVILAVVVFITITRLDRTETSHNRTP
jgi:uncharacterized membrane-anchored protein